MNLKISISGTPAQKKKMEAAFKLAVAILQSDEFKKATIEQTYEVYRCTGFWRWKKCVRTLEDGFTNTTHTPKQVYETISNAISEFSWTCDGGKNGRVIGYTFADKKQIYTYKWVIDSYLVYELAGHLIHEWLHVLGYSHNSAKDHNSVPYALGYDAEMIGKNLVGAK